MAIGSKSKKSAKKKIASTDELKDFIIQSLEEDKAEDIVCIDLADKTDFARYMIVATCRSTRHCISTADKVADRLIKEGLPSVSIEGKTQGDWVLIDAKDIIINLFKHDIRQNYEIEKIWGF